MTLIEYRRFHHCLLIPSYLNPYRQVVVVVSDEYHFQQHKSKAKVGFNDIPEEFELSAAAFLTSSMWRRKGDPEIFLPGVYLLRMELGCFDELISNELIRKLGTEQDR